MATGAARYDVVVVDRMLPALDGLSLVRAMRAAGSATPALFLTHLSGVDDRVEGLEAGGDDYLVKPFAFEELMARLAALARRPTLGAEPTVLASPTSRWTSFAARCGAAASRSTCSRASSGCSNSSCAARAAC